MTTRNRMPDFEAAFFHSDAAAQTEHGAMRLRQQAVGRLTLTTGKIVACDAFIPGSDVFVRTVSPGRYPVVVSITECAGVGQYVAAAMLCFSGARPLVWDIAAIAGRDPARDDLFSYGVDCAAGCFADLDAMRFLLDSREAYAQYAKVAHAQLHNVWSYDAADVPLGDGGLNVIVFSSGAGDGAYPSYFGYDRHGEVACLATDFGIISPVPYQDYSGREQLTLEL